MNVLVTGGAGFLGAHLIASLEAAGHRAFAFDVGLPGAEMSWLAPTLLTRLRQGSVLDRTRLVEVCRADGIEAIVHAAGRVGFAASVADPVAFYETNVMGMAQVCEAARVVGVPKLIAISSNSVYNGGSSPALLETDSPFSLVRANPTAHYGTSKMAAEAIGLAYADFHDLDYLALRVTAIYGFGMRIPLYIKPMVEDAVLGRPTRFETGGPMKRDYTHVLDCCRAVVAAVAAPRLPAGSPRAVNIASGQLRSAAEVADIVRRTIPGADIEIGDGLTVLEQGNIKSRAPLDIALANRMLGWAPALGIEAGVREYADTFSAWQRSSKTSTT